jgi:hypothetical protein
VLSLSKHACPAHTFPQAKGYGKSRSLHALNEAIIVSHEGTKARRHEEIILRLGGAGIHHPAKTHGVSAIFSRKENKIRPNPAAYFLLSLCAFARDKLHGIKAPSHVAVYLIATVDLANHVFQIPGCDASGEVLIAKGLRRGLPNSHYSPCLCTVQKPFEG